jgi:hypothetical protein
MCLLPIKLPPAWLQFLLMKKVSKFSPKLKIMYLNFVHGNFFWSGNNSIVVILGANLLLSVEDVNKCENLIKNCKVFVTNLELPLESVIRALELAKAHNGNSICLKYSSNVSSSFVHFAFKY